uniref:MULE transposase domain-containing protein n=1 Tax=Fagus sylvatica TaxID=28930 RepID=A0A2N9F599_FAGSY
MDVAANNWATAASPSAGPISAKSAIFIKNATILVAKHTKNLAKNGAWQSTLSLKQSHHLEQRQRPTFEIWSSIEREFWSFGGPLHWCIDCTVHVVVAVMSTQEMDGVRSFGASNSFVEDLPQPVEGNMQEDTPESVRNSVIEPRVGMEFDSLQQVIEFYKHYAYSKGFATMTRNSRKKKGFSETSYVNLKCNREGKYSSSVDDPSKKRHFAAFRHISTDTRRRLLINDNAGVRINSSIKASVVEAGGYENMTYNQRDVRNFLEKERRLKCKEGDGQALHDYFVRMQAKNSNFYHALDLDDELRVRNVFWVDARSRAAYESFNDVITFDTTYLTNKYDMPFAPFIGINHHGESIILGCGLLSSEDTDSFVWVFRQWLQSMCDIAPKAIITDQCQAMRRAIEIVFPETVHRWCIWHITMKLPVKLAGLEAYQDIKHYLLKAVHDSMTVEEFEEKWNHTITLHHLEENEWLAKLYEERERWVPAFLNSNFFAGMSSTQRSESMNAFFDGKLECSSSSPMEKQFQEAYTHEIFKRVRLEFAGRQGCIVNELVRGSDEVKYKIEDEACPGKLFEVRFNSSECLVGCPSSQRKNSVGAAPPDVVRTEVVRSPMVVKRKGRPRMKRLKSSMEEAVSKPKKKRNTAAARNLAHSTSTTGVGGSAYGDCSTSNMEYPVSMPHSHDGVIHLTNPMPSQSFVSESMSQTQAHGNEDQALNLT